MTDILDRTKSICDGLSKLDPDREEFTGYDEAAVEILPELMVECERMQEAVKYKTGLVKQQTKILNERDQQIDVLIAEIARLKDALRSAYMQDIFYGANWITWRYTSGFDRADEATQQKMAKEKAEELMRREGHL